MIFKEWFYFIEAVDPAVRDAILSSKWPYAKEKILLAANELEKEYDGKTSPSKKDAFKFIHQVLGHERRRRLPPTPENDKLKAYHDKMLRREITVPEYKLAQKYIDNPALDEVLTGLRQLIKDKVITFAFKTEPEIKYKKKIIRDFKSLNQILSNIHHIQDQLGQQGDPQEQSDIKETADPALLAVSNAADLVYHVPANPATGKKDIWVFKGSDPLKCRLMGKGQSWCIASSSSVNHYFNYKHINGQTQYFIFDYNKPPDDPTRYVNPGIAPTEEDDEDFYKELEEPYEEWVDSENKPNELQGYKSVDDYKKYLKSMGVPLNVFTADRHTAFEKKLFNIVHDGNWREAFKDPKLWHFYWQIANKLPDEAYKHLTRDEKYIFLKNKSIFLTSEQLLDVFNLYETNRKKFWEWAEGAFHIKPEEFMEVAKKYLRKLNNKDEELAFWKEWYKNTKLHLSAVQTDYLLKNFGSKGVEAFEGLMDKLDSIHSYPLYMSLTGKMPPNFLQKLHNYSENDNWNGVSWFLRTLIKMFRGGDNIPKVLQSIPEKYFQKAAEASRHAEMGAVDFLQGFAENPYWFMDMESIKKADKIIKDKLGLPQSIFHYIPTHSYADIKNKVLNSESIEDDVKNYVMTNLPKGIIKDMSVSSTVHHGMEPDTLAKRAEEMSLQTQNLIRLLDANWSKLDTNDLFQILETHANKRDLLRYYKQKGVKLEDLFENPSQIERFIKNLVSTGRTWPDQYEALYELGPEVIQMLPASKLLNMVASRDYRQPDHIGNPDITRALATMIPITPENVRGILYALGHADEKTLDKVKKGPYFDVIKNADSETKREWLHTRLHHNMPVVFYDHNDLHNLSANDLLSVVTESNFDMNLLDEFTKRRLIALLHFPIPRHLRLSSVLYKLLPLMTEQEIKDLIPALIKAQGRTAVGEAMFWVKNSGKIPQGVIDDLPEDVKRYMDPRYR